MSSVNILLNVERISLHPNPLTCTAFYYCLPSRCYIALKRNHDNQKLAAAFLKKMTDEGTGKIGARSGAENVAMQKEAVVKRDEKDAKDVESVKQLRGK